MQEWFAYSEALVQSGAMVSGEPLQGTETATTVQIRDSKTVTTDGPFAETKEILGGYYLIDVNNLGLVRRRSRCWCRLLWGSLHGPLYFTTVRCMLG